MWIQMGEVHCRFWWNTRGYLGWITPYLGNHDSTGVFSIPLQLEGSIHINHRIVLNEGCQYCSFRWLRCSPLGVALSVATFMVEYPLPKNPAEIRHTSLYVRPDVFHLKRTIGTTSWRAIATRITDSPSGSQVSIRSGYFTSRWWNNTSIHASLHIMNAYTKRCMIGIYNTYLHGCFIPKVIWRIFNKRPLRTLYEAFRSMVQVAQAWNYPLLFIWWVKDPMIVR